MRQRRNARHGGISETCWRFLNDLPPLKDACHWELTCLENNQLDCSTGYTAQDAWELHRDVILPEWIRRHPGSRPVCWWRFDSGIERKRGPIKLTELHTVQNAIFSWRDSIPEDQRGWLQEHGLLQEGE